MTCYHPLIRCYQFSDHSKTIKILKSQDYEKYDPDTCYFISDAYNPRKVSHDGHTERYVGYEKIPCGQCIGCRLDYSRQWATRCTLESKLYAENWFLTLTYNEENLPESKGQWINPETGEIIEPEIKSGSLDPDDATNFVKRLRRHWEYHYNHKGIRFFLVGEYGGKTQRPHYHAIIFNLHIKPENLKPLFINAEHQQIYTCEEIEKIWGKGIVALGDVTWSSCAYVARYMLKKVKGPGSKEEYARRGQAQEFSRMSRMPGIGAEYYKSHKDEIYKTDEIILPSGLGKINTLKPPKYYDNLYDLENPEAMAAIKETRKKRALENTKTKLSKTTLSEKEMLEAAESAKQAKSKKLIRSLEE